MKKLSEIKITASVFYFILTLWTLMVMGLSIAIIYAANETIVGWMIFPEYVFFDLFIIGNIVTLLLSVFLPLTLVLFYARLIVGKISLAWMKRLFFADAALLFIFSLLDIILMHDWGILQQFLILIVPHSIILWKLESFFHTIEKERLQVENN
jgi:hypothetical protein